MITMKLIAYEMRKSQKPWSRVNRPSTENFRQSKGHNNNGVGREACNKTIVKRDTHVDTFFVFTRSILRFSGT